MQCFIEIHVKIKVKTCRVMTRKCEETDTGYAIRTEGMTLTDNELIFSVFSTANGQFALLCPTCIDIIFWQIHDGCLSYLSVVG